MIKIKNSWGEGNNLNIFRVVLHIVSYLSYRILAAYILSLKHGTGNV